MRRCCAVAATGAAAAALFGFRTGGQADLGLDKRERALLAADDMAKRGFPALITTGADGLPRARTVNVRGPAAGFGATEKDDARIWLGTARGTRKVAELKANSSACLYYADVPANGYTAVSGRITVHDGGGMAESEARERAWSTEFALFYSGGKSGPQFLALEFTPLRLEVVSQKYEVAHEPQAWRPHVLVRAPGEPWREETAAADGAPLAGDGALPA